MSAKKIKVLLLSSVPFLSIVNPVIFAILIQYLPRVAGLSFVILGKGIIMALIVPPFLWWDKKWKKLKEIEQDIEIKECIERADNFYELLFISIVSIGIALSGASILFIPFMGITFLIIEGIIGLFGGVLSQSARGWIIVVLLSITALVIFYFVMKFMLKRRQRKKELASPHT